VLHADLQAELIAVRKRRAFDAKGWINKKTDMLNAYMTEGGLKAGCVSVSGGVDSAVTIGLLLKAKSKKGSPIQRVLGIAQPIHSTKKIQDRAYELCDAMGAEVITVDQSSLHTQLCGIVDKSIGIAGAGFASGQLRSYMRTPVNYYVAQLLSQNGTPCVVFGTGNQDEDGYLRYFCKAGDGVADIQLIADLHKSEVFAIGRELGVPESILVAAPSADLWDGQTDEDELGFSYDFIEMFTEYLEYDAKKKKAFRAKCSAAALDQLDTCGAKAADINRRNAHKANFPHNINIMKMGGY